MPNIFQQITKGGLQNVISNIRDLSSQLKMTGGGSDFSLYKTIQKDYLDKYKKPSGGYDTKKFEQINKRKSEINQYVKTNPIGDRQDQGILGLYGQTELKAPHENSLLESQDRKQRWVKTQMPSIVNRLPYSELQREFPDDISILEQRYDQQELTLKKTREALALDRIRLSQQKYVTDAIYDPVTDTWKSKDFEKKTISAFEYNPNSNLHNDFIKTNELFAQSIVAGLSGYETQAYKEAMESGDFLAKFTASGGNLVGFVGALMGVGAVTRSIGFGVKTATVLSKMGLGQKAARLGAELIKSGVNFTLLGQVHSTVRGESWKEHFKSAGVDFVSGVGLTLGGMAVSKFPKLVQPLLEGSAWAGITKAQGGDNETALIQGILFGGMRGFGLMKPSLEGVNEMTADKFLTESEKFLKAKRGDSEGIIRAFTKKTENMKPTSPEYHKAEASAVALLYPRQVFGMVKNIASFKESRPAGLFGEGKFKEGERPGIEKAAPLPDAQGVEWNRVEITPKLSDKVLKSPTFAFLGGEKKLTPEELYKRGEITKEELLSRKVETLKQEKKKSPQEAQDDLRVRQQIPESPIKDMESSYRKSITEKPKSVKEAIKQEKDFNDSTTPPIPKSIVKVIENAPNLKDISGFKGQFRDMYRNFRAVFGKDSAMEDYILKPFDESKGRYVDEQILQLSELKEQVVDKLNIKKGSKKSAALMDYGEKLLTKEQIVKKWGEKGADEIVEADKWFRSKYDQFIEEVNKIREVIYPRSPEKQIPKRKDYYRHYQEMASDFQGLINIFETPAAIDPHLSGISPFTKPKSKFLSFAQKRLGMMTERDAVGGFLNYLPSYAYAKHIDPNIGKFRKLSTALADSTEQSKNLNNFIENLNDFANNLSGKTNDMDRYIQKIVPGGRKTFRVLTWLNSRIKANTVLGNLRSSISQIFNVPQGIANAGPINSIKGLNKTVAQVFVPNEAMKNSTFIKERYHTSFYQQFNEGILAKPKKFAIWITGVLDEAGTKFIWNSHYSKAIAEGIKDPISYADNITRSMVAGRGVGEVPLAQQSKVFQLIAPFQLEVGNFWWALGDVAKTQGAKGVMTLFAVNYLMNRAAEEITGSDVVYDPINALVEGVAQARVEADMKSGAIKVVGRQMGEFLSNIPMGQTLATMYPEYGASFLPPRKEFFGEGDPTRFGGGILAVKGLQDPVFKVLFPYGGGQIKKTYESAKSIFLDDGEVRSKSGKTVNFVIDKSDPLNVIQSLMFGKYSSKEGQSYLKGSRTDLLTEKSKNKILTTEEKQEVTEAITKAVESGEMTEQSAKTKITNIKKNQFNVKTIQNFKKAGYSKEVIQSKIEAAVNNGTITKTQAEFIWEAF